MWCFMSHNVKTKAENYKKLFIVKSHQILKIFFARLQCPTLKEKDRNQLNRNQNEVFLKPNCLVQIS